MADPGRRLPRFDFIAGGSAGNAAHGPADIIWWRVAAANNRALGRSASTFATIADCREHVRQLQDRIDELTPSYASDARGQWTWSATLDAAVAARSVRPFARRIDCMRTLSLFLDAARAADPARADVRLVAGRVRGATGGVDGR